MKNRKQKSISYKYRCFWNNYIHKVLNIFFTRKDLIVTLLD